MVVEEVVLGVLWVVEVVVEAGVKVCRVAVGSFGNMLEDWRGRMLHADQVVVEFVDRMAGLSRDADLPVEVVDKVVAVVRLLWSSVGDLG